MVEFAVVPERTALLSIDLQNCFVAGSEPRGEQVLARVNGLARVCRAAGIPVVHVRHALASTDRSGVLGEIFPGVEELLDRDSETAALHPDLDVDERDLLVEKPHFGAFHGTDLEARLRALAVDTVIVAGIETNVCCETTAREAMVRDFRVLFLSDGTTTGGVPGLSVDEVQRASLATVGMFFAEVLTVDEVAARIHAAARSATGA
jgi:ureidoacrylate peracid hydrolase